MPYDTSLAPMGCPSGLVGILVHGLPADPFFLDRPCLLWSANGVPADMWLGHAVACRVQYFTRHRSSGTSTLQLYAQCLYLSTSQSKAGTPATIGTLLAGFTAGLPRADQMYPIQQRPTLNATQKYSDKQVTTLQAVTAHCVGRMQIPAA